MNNMVFNRFKDCNFRLLNMKSKRGMEMVQVAILVAIAIAIGLLFKDKIMDFVNNTFDNLEESTFSTYTSKY